MGLGIYAVSILPSLYVILFSNGLLNPSSRDLINVPDDDYFLLPNSYSYEQRIITKHPTWVKGKVP